MTATVFENIKSLTGTPYNRAEHNKDILDYYVLRKARADGFRLPTGTAPDEWNYLGAHVFTPRAGLNRNVMYLDLSSLYPNLMRALNVGPDTIVGTEEELADSQWSEDDCVWGYIDTRPVKHVDEDEDWQDFTDGEYKMVYDPEASGSKVKWTTDEPRYERCYYLHPDVRVGFLRDLVQDLIDLKYQYEGSKYEAVKRIVNSIYGFCSYLTENTSSRLAHWRLGETITLSGRKVIQYTASRAVEEMKERHDADCYITIGDTDGAGLCWPNAPSRAVMREYVLDIVDDVNEEMYPAWMHETFGVDADEHYMAVEAESFAPSLFVPAKNPDGDGDEGVKKRYMQWLTLKDLGTDEEKEVDEISITGLEATRSDTANVTQEAQERFADAVLRHGKTEAAKQLFPWLRDTHEAIRTGAYSIEDIAVRGGIGKRLSEYGTENRTPQPIYRGAKYADQHVEGETLGVGSKPRVYYVKRIHGDIPRTYTAETAEDGRVVDAIAVEDPDNLPDCIDLDYDKHVTKALEGPMRPLLRTYGWSWDEVLHQHTQSGLVDF